jgi:type I restriction enzyme S subunit
MTAPGHWEIFPLNALVDVLDNLRVPVNSSERSKRPGSIPYYGATGQVGTIDKAIFNEELLVLGEDGVQFFDQNKPKAYKISGPAWVNNHAHVLRPKKDRVLQNFLLHFLNQFNYIGYANGTTRLKLTQGAMNSIPVPLPSIAEQHKILEHLEDHLSRLDAAIADVKQAKVKAAQFRQSLLNSVYFGREFELASLGTCVELIMGQAPPGDTCNKDGIGTPFVKVGEFAELHPTIEEWTLKPLRLAKMGDVLICVVGATVGKINLGIDCAIGRSVAAIRPKNTLKQKYLYYFLELKMLEIRGQSKGSAQGVITKDYINSIQIPLPEMKVQEDVLDLLDSNFSQIEKTIEMSNIIERESLALRRSLLQAAFTGQLTNEVVSV